MGRARRPLSARARRPRCYAAAMLVPARRLLARVRQVPTRTAELAALRRRLRAARADAPGDDERVLADRIRALKQALSAAIAAPACCTGCAAGQPAPGGTFAGGHCCSGVTADIFVDDEVAALALAGTRPGDLAGPRTEHAGCAFRGPTGCTLTPGDRATLCARYLCDDLRRELHADGRLDAIEALVAELGETFARFRALRAARLERAWLDALTRDVARTA